MEGSADDGKGLEAQRSMSERRREFVGIAVSFSLLKSLPDNIIVL